MSSVCCYACLNNDQCIVEIKLWVPFRINLGDWLGRSDGIRAIRGICKNITLVSVAGQGSMGCRVNQEVTRSS